MTSDIFGYGLAFDGLTVVGGAPFATINGVSQPGRAIVFEPVGGAWTQTRVLRPSVIQASAFFGVAAAVDGDTIVVGAPGEDTETADSGAAYVFERVGGQWTETARLIAPDGDADDGFGGALALQGDRLVIGASQDSTAGGSGAGSVYVFDRTSGTWNFTVKLSPADGSTDDRFGGAVALDGDTLLAGARYHTHSDVPQAGIAYVFRRLGGMWLQIDTLRATKPETGSEFGYSVALLNGAAAVGAYDETENGLARAGAAYVFVESEDQWLQRARLTAPEPGDGDHFGTAVSLHDNTLLVGAYLDDNIRGNGAGGVHVFRRSGQTWRYHTLLTAGDAGGTLFGWRLALAGDRAAIAAPFYQTNRGAVYVFNGFAQPCEPCDVNCDGSVNQFDIQGFVDLLSANPSAGCAPCAGDASGDGSVNAFDIQPFVDCLSAP